MSDLISRRAAIEAVGYYSLHSGDKLLFADNTLKELPSAQPEITLESAIDYLNSIGWMQEHDRIMAESAHAHNESETGFLCSACRFGDFGQFNHGGKYAPNYCPNCGAKMDEEASE